MEKNAACILEELQESDVLRCVNYTTMTSGNGIGSTVRRKFVKEGGLCPVWTKVLHRRVLRRC